MMSLKQETQNFNRIIEFLETLGLCTLKIVTVLSCRMKFQTFLT